MKYRCLAGLWGLAMMAGAQADHLKVSFEDVVLLNQRGVSEQTLLLFLENRVLTFELDAITIDKLMTAGVSEEVIRYLVSQTQPEHAPPDTTAKEKVPESTSITNYVPYPVYPAYFYTPNYYSYSYIYGRSYYPHDWFGLHYRFGYNSARPHAVSIFHDDRRYAVDHFVHRPRVHHNNSNADHHVASERHRAGHRTHSEERDRHEKQRLHHDSSAGHSRSGRHIDSRPHRAGHSVRSRDHKKHHERSHERNGHSGDRDH
ncbi:MAG: hypothetical protein GXP14_06020 [Gammaproteobacteria bacterium]|nr:hypothetical protein [Gammaproteobacteria bacterium]